MAKELMAKKAYVDALRAPDVKARPDNWTPSAAEVHARPDTWVPEAKDISASDGSATSTVQAILNDMRQSVAQGKAAVANAITNKGINTTGTDSFSQMATNIAAIKTPFDGSLTSRSSSDLTVSGATVTAPAGYYAAAASKSIATGSAKTPATTKAQSTPSISIDSAGKITASVAATSVSVTPAVTAGYITTGTAGTVTMSASSNTKQMTTQAAKTWTPGTANQTIAAGTYLTGAQTISGDANLKVENIKKGVTIFGKTGTAATMSGLYATGSATITTSYNGSTSVPRSIIPNRCFMIGGSSGRSNLIGWVNGTFEYNGKRETWTSQVNGGGSVCGISVVGVTSDKIQLRSSDYSATLYYSYQTSGFTYGSKTLSRGESWTFNVNEYPLDRMVFCLNRGAASDGTPYQDFYLRSASDSRVGAEIFTYDTYPSSYYDGPAYSSAAITGVSTSGITLTYSETANSNNVYNNYTLTIYYMKMDI